MLFLCILLYIYSSIQVRGLIRLYIIDLESANGTYLNNNRIESRRYYELLEKDVIKFGFSTREYVVMTSETDMDDSSWLYFLYSVCKYMFIIIEW